MQTLHPERNYAEQDLAPADRPVSDPAEAYAHEVRSLRQRVATLEAELAATKAAQDGAQAVPASAVASIDVTSTPACEHGASEFSASVAPAVQPAECRPQPARVADDTPGFAQAWTEETEAASFEERLAEKAFFQASTVDQQSRRWLLDD